MMAASGHGHFRDQLVLNCQHYMTPTTFLFIYCSLTALNDVASSGADYLGPISVLTFTPFTGSQTQSFTVQILPDTLVEFDETFEIDLGIPAGSTSLAQLGNPSKTVVTIDDDDCKLIYVDYVISFLE